MPELTVRGFGERRLRILLALQQWPELDEPDWRGSLHLDFGPGGSVKSPGPVSSPRELSRDA